ncbi:MAG: TIGR03643 family protein [Verrucomicrobiales bacterium]
MKRKSKAPLTLTKNPEPKKGSQEWIIWAAWADRVTFEEIYERTGLNENEVKKLMKKNLKQKSYINWRNRVNSRKTKHRKLFMQSRNKYSLNLD